MELTKFDATVITSMAATVIILSTVFPYVGLAAADPARASDVPTPKIADWSANNPVFEPPLKPLGPKEARYIVYENGLKTETYYSGTYEGNKTEVYIEVYGHANLTEAILTKDVYDSNGDLAQINTSSVSFYGNETGVTKRASINDTWAVDVTLEKYNANTSNGDKYTIRVKQIEMANSGGGLIFNIIESSISLAKVVLYIGKLILYGISVLVEYLITAATQGINFAIWLYEVIAWIAAGYMAMIANATAWSLLFLLVPLILLGYEAIKIQIIIAGVLPTT